MSSQVLVYMKALQANVSLLHCSCSVSSKWRDIFQSSNFTIQEYFLFFLFQEECWLWNCLTVSWTWNILVKGLLVLAPLLLLIGGLIVGFTKVNHLCPALGLSEYIENVSVLEIIVAAWMHESTKFQAIIFKLSQISIWYHESFLHLFILQLKGCLTGTILDLAKDLKHKEWFFDRTSISANLLISSFSFTHIAFVLNLDKVNISYESTNLDDIPNYGIIWYGFNKLDLRACLEVINLIFNLTNDHQILSWVLSLDIDVNVIRDLS
jgi:hypothetical protein